MSRKCTISSKGSQWGNNVSHANNKTSKIWQPNLHTKRLFDTESGKWIKVKVSSRVMRTIDKKGLSQTLKDYGLTLADIR